MGPSLRLMSWSELERSARSTLVHAVWEIAMMLAALGLRRLLACH
jgi:hypothetical protein